METGDADLDQDETDKTLLWTPLHWAASDDRAGACCLNPSKVI